MPLTNENYFSLENQMKYMGVSQFKAFEDCQASAFAEVTGNFEREVTTSLLVGSYVDAHFEGSLDGATPHRNDGASVGAWHSTAEHADVVSSVMLIVVIFGAERVGHKCNREIDISLTVDASLDKFQIRFHNVFSFHKINFDFAYSKVRLRIIRAGQ